MNKFAAYSISFALGFAVAAIVVPKHIKECCACCCCDNCQCVGKCCTNEPVKKMVYRCVLQSEKDYQSNVMFIGRNNYGSFSLQGYTNVIKQLSNFQNGQDYQVEFIKLNPPKEMPGG